MNKKTERGGPTLVQATISTIKDHLHVEIQRLLLSLASARGQQQLRHETLWGFPRAMKTEKTDVIVVASFSENPEGSTTLQVAAFPHDCGVEAAKDVSNSFATITMTVN